MIPRLALALVLLVPTVAPAQMTPMGFGRPPGHGPELDQHAIAQMRGLQSFITGDLGVTLTDPGRIRAGVMERAFWGSWRLQSVYRNRFQSWMRTFFSTPGAMVLGISVAGMDYSMSHLQADYNESALGDYYFFHGRESAEEKLVRDGRKLHRMAQGYIDRLEARLTFEAEHSGAARQAVEAGTSDHFSDLRPNKTPSTILNTNPKGRQHVEDLLRRRRKAKGIE